MRRQFHALPDIFWHMLLITTCSSPPHARYCLDFICNDTAVLVQGWLHLGLSLMSCGDLTESVAALNKAAKLEPTSQDAWFGLAHCEKEVGHCRNLSDASLHSFCTPVFMLCVHSSSTSRKAHILMQLLQKTCAQTLRRCHRRATCAGKRTALSIIRQQDLAAHLHMMQILSCDRKLVCS